MYHKTAPTLPGIHKKLYCYEKLNNDIIFIKMPFIFVIFDTTFTKKIKFLFSALVCIISINKSNTILLIL